MSHYETLGVPPDADDATIKRAYRRKASKAHPDKGGNTADFQTLQRAHAVLSDPAARERYDRTGRDSEPKDQVETEAQNLLARGFDNYLESADEGRSPIDFIRSGIENGRSENAEKIHNLRTRLAAIERKAKNAKRKGRGHDLFAQIAHGKIQTLNAQIDSIEIAMRIQARTLELLADYESLVVERPSPLFIRPMYRPGGVIWPDLGT